MNKIMDNIDENIETDDDWNYDFLDELTEDIEENRNLLQCISCGKCVGKRVWTSL